MSINYNFSILDQRNAFARDDKSDDMDYFSREQTHIHHDARALQTIEDIIDNLTIEDNPRVLELLSDANTLIPDSVSAAEIVGIGFSNGKMQQNERLTRYTAQDLNKQMELPYSDEYFDIIINNLSVEYLTNPIAVFKEAGRVLKPGGLFVVTFSNRMIAEKAVNIWKESNEQERVLLVDDMFRQSRQFTDSKVFASIGKPRPQEDKYAVLGIPSDPVFAVYAEKIGGPEMNRPNLNKIMTKDLKWDKIKRNKEKIRDTHKCPYCDERLDKWIVSENPFFSTWENEYLYICFNDACDYYVRGWDYMFRNGYGLCSYRFMYDDVADACHPVPVQNPKALKEGVLEQG